MRWHFVAALFFVGCTSNGASPTSWATRLEPAPKGLTLDPPPPDDVYFVAVASAEIPPKNGGGQPWDESSGLADPKVILLVDDKEVMSTAAADDTLAPSWGAPHANLYIPDSATLTVEVVQTTALSNLPIGSGKAGPPTAADLTAGRMTVDIGNRGSVQIRVAPAHALIGLGFDYEANEGMAIVTRVLSRSPAGRAGFKAGDELVAIGEKKVGELQQREIRSAINAIGGTPVKVVVRHKGGTTETFDMGVGPIYPLYAEYGEID